jgi:ketosteroid isomerase-like protein
VPSAAHDDVSRTLSSINQAWLEGKPRDLEALFDPKIVMLDPAGSYVKGRTLLVESFVQMCANVRVHGFEESDRQVDVFGDTAVASFAFVLVYEREGQKYRSTGRDLWVFSRDGAAWRAVYRTMLNLAEEPV